MFQLTTLGATPKRIDSNGIARLEVLIGEDALSSLEKEEFKMAWECLQEACPWSTAFQSYPYVATWYQVYKDVYVPILIRYTLAGKLTGLLALALDSQGVIVGAGAEQAEYQVWVTKPEDEEAFVSAAFREVLKQFPGAAIRLKYVPGGANLQWIYQSLYWKRHCLVRPVKQPLMGIDEDYLNAELRKKNRREKINRLKRLGHLNFERVNNADRFDEVIDELTLQYDFRKGAMFNRNLFRADPRRRQFLGLLFERGLLHTTLLTVDEKVIASNAGVIGKGWLHLQGLNTHCPTFAKYSPGILHFLFLGKQLAEEGITVFDLTPGADPYKNILATDYGTAYQLDIVGSYTKLIRGFAMHMRKHVKAGAMAVGIRQETLRMLKKKIEQFHSRAGGGKLLSSTSRKAAEVQPILLTEACSAYSVSTELPLQYCSLKDLMDYVPSKSDCTRWEFLEAAMRRLETGEKCYTWSEHNLLLSCVWVGLLAPASGKAQLDGNTVLELSYCHTSVKEKLPDFLQAIARQVQQEKPGPVYALVNARDGVYLAAPSFF
ncbi:GNAT family N-acetyltransferase [Pontibacter flavimaris]|nr:GNAT family N-acetyltransferase [Pontibacter flavimaris]